MSTKHQGLHLLENGEETWSLPLPDDLAYVVGTSGTTGQPKLVFATRRAIKANVDHLIHQLRLDRSELIAVTSPLSFDPALLDLFLAAELDCDVVVLPRSVRASPGRLRQSLRKHPPSFMQATPSLLAFLGPEFLRDHLLHPSSRLRSLLIGGEAFPARFLRPLLPEASDLR